MFPASSARGQEHPRNCQCNFVVPVYSETIISCWKRENENTASLYCDLFCLSLCQGGLPFSIQTAKNQRMKYFHNLHQLAQTSQNLEAEAVRVKNKDLGHGTKRRRSSFLVSSTLVASQSPQNQYFIALLILQVYPGCLCK